MKSGINNIIYLLCLFQFTQVGSQNLVLNPSFENHSNCPSRLGNFVQDLEDWTTPTLGSSDYFNSCSQSMGVPSNFNGSQKAKHGNAYAGLYLYAPDDYREYIQASLSQPLKNGDTYKISFYISLAENSDTSVKGFGVLFSERPFRIDFKKELSKMQLAKLKDNASYLLEIHNKDYLNDTENWISLETEFVANGTERFLTLGNFKNNLQTIKSEFGKKSSKKGAYYYLDLVTLTSMKDGHSLEKKQVFKSILFPFDKYELTDATKIEILAIYEYLKENPNLAIAIHGHADALGYKDYNEKLSEKRAKTVVNYLLLLGLSKDRMHWQSHGSRQPKVENLTDVGRQNNRRVEFVICELNN